MGDPVVEQLRSLRSVASGIDYGEKPNVTVSSAPPQKIWVGVLVVTALVRMIGCMAFGMEFFKALTTGISYGMLAVSLPSSSKYYLLIV